MFNRINVLFDKLIKTVTLWVLYIPAWFIPVYLIPIVNNVCASGFLSWYYLESLPPLTEKMFLLLWLVMMVMTCIMLALTIDGTSHKQNGNGKLFPISAFIISQAISSVVYIVGAVFSGYENRFYYPTSLLSYTINEFNQDIITKENESSWLLFLTVFITAIFSGLSIAVYLIRRKQQEALIEIQERYLREKYKS